MAYQSLLFNFGPKAGVKTELDKYHSRQVSAPNLTPGMQDAFQASEGVRLVPKCIVVGDPKVFSSKNTWQYLLAFNGGNLLTGVGHKNRKLNKITINLNL